MRHWLIGAGVSGVMGIGFGAFAAHSLNRYGDPQMVEWVKTGASYQLWHAAALAALAGWGERFASPWITLAAHGFFWGALIFAVSLYLLAALHLRWLGAITPIGGVVMMLGWLSLMIAGWRQARSA
ncbi:MAG: DUF423 domain-containing protein [Dongiaceae bacterium]